MLIYECVPHSRFHLTQKHSSLLKSVHSEVDANGLRPQLHPDCVSLLHLFVVKNDTHTHTHAITTFCRAIWGWCLPYIKLQQFHVCLGYLYDAKRKALCKSELRLWGLILAFWRICSSRRGFTPQSFTGLEHFRWSKKTKKFTGWLMTRYLSFCELKKQKTLKMATHKVNI